MSRGSTGDASGPPALPYAQRNYVLAVINGAMGNLSDSFLNPQLILAAFLYLLTHSKALVGLLMIVETAGQMWPQLFVSRYIEHWPRKQPFYIGATSLRIAGLLTLMASMWLMGDSVHRGLPLPSWTLWLFFLGRFMHRSGDGATLLVFLDIVGQSIDERRRGRLFASRGFFGDALAMAAGPMLVQPILRHFTAPSNYLLLSAIGAAILVFGWTIFCFIRERPNENPIQERTFKEVLADGVDLLRSDPMYRRLLVYRMLVRVATLTLAFYVPFGTDLLGAAGLGGLFVGLLGAARLVSAPIWGHVCDRFGSKVCLTGASLGYMAAPILALVSVHLPGVFSIPLPWGHVTLTLRLAVFLLALVVFGLGQRADFIADSSFLLEHAPADRRCSYQAFLSLVTFPMTLLPGLAGWLADQPWCGLERLFAAITLVCVGMLLASSRLWAVPAEAKAATIAEPCPQCQAPAEQARVDADARGQ